MESNKTKNEYSRIYNSYATIYNNQLPKTKGREIIEAEIMTLNKDISQYKRNLESRFKDFVESVTEDIKSEELKPIYLEEFQSVEVLISNMDSFYNEMKKNDTLKTVFWTVNTLYQRELNQEAPNWQIELMSEIFDKIQAFKNRRKIAQDIINTIVADCYPTHLELLEGERDKKGSEGKIGNEDYTDGTIMREGESKHNNIIQKWVNKGRLTNSERYDVVIEIKREFDLNSDKDAFEFALKKGVNFGGQTKYHSWVKMNQRKKRKSGQNQP